MNLGKNFALPLPFCVSLFTYFVVAFLIIFYLILPRPLVLDKKHVKGTRGSSVTNLGKNCLLCVIPLSTHFGFSPHLLYICSLDSVYEVCRGNKGIIGDSSW